jgi:hypothetical protein
VYQQPLPLRQRGTALQRRSTCPYAALTPRGKPLMVAGARASAHTFRLRAASTGLHGWATAAAAGRRTSICRSETCEKNHYCTSICCSCS